jgi:hypothetical protein
MHADNSCICKLAKMYRMLPEMDLDIAQHGMMQLQGVLFTDSYWPDMDPTCTPNCMTRVWNCKSWNLIDLVVLTQFVSVTHLFAAQRLAASAAGRYAALGPELTQHPPVTLTAPVSVHPAWQPSQQHLGISASGSNVQSQAPMSPSQNR